MRDSLTEIAEGSGSGALQGISGATILRGSIHISGPATQLKSVKLLDISGREAMKLQPGANDIRHLAPGVYFVRSESGRTGRVWKVVLTR